MTRNRWMLGIFNLSGKLETKYSFYLFIYFKAIFKMWRVFWESESGKLLHYILLDINVKLSSDYSPSNILLKHFSLCFSCGIWYLCCQMTRRWFRNFFSFLYMRFFCCLWDKMSFLHIFLSTLSAQNRGSFWFLEMAKKSCR